MRITRYFIVWEERDNRRKNPVVLKERGFTAEYTRQKFLDKIRMRGSFVKVVDWRTES